MIEPKINSRPEVVNLEVGCGCGNFGKRYFSECFGSDKRSKAELKQVCSQFQVDFSCSANAIPSPNNRFIKVIVCNPYNYGFRDKEDSEILLNEFSRVVKNNGTFIIVSNNRNPYATPQRIVDRIKEFNAKSTYKLTTIVNDIDPTKDYRGHTFYTCNGEITTPNFKIEVQCTKE